MGRTPDRRPGENIEEGTVYQPHSTDPTAEGGVS